MKKIIIELDIKEVEEDILRKLSSTNLSSNMFKEVGTLHRLERMGLVQRERGANVIAVFHLTKLGRTVLEKLDDK